MGNYDDILNIQRPPLRKHSPMSMEARAAQFAPFAALTGYEAVIEEAARLTARRIDLDEDARQELDRLLNLLSARTEPPGEPVPVQLTWFEPDGLKLGGSYCTAPVFVHRVDRICRLLELEDQRCIPIENVLDLRFDGGTGE